VSQPSSSILNFNRVFPRNAIPMIFLIMWTLLGLLAIDLSINYLFAYPNDPKLSNPSRLQQYFEYGRTAEGQLFRMTRQDRSQTAPITLAGWYDPLQIEGPSNVDVPAVTFYGASHTVRLARALGRVSNRFSSRIVGAPGATANWSYGAYLRDRGGGKSRAAILTFNSNNFAMISSFSPMIWSVDQPIPYMGDRFYLNGVRLRVIHAPYTSFDKYVRTFFDHGAWTAALDFFAANDPLYRSFAVRANILDHSALWRLYRRAHSQNIIKDLQRSILDRSGFRPDAEEIKVAHAIIHEFAAQARSQGIIPIIFIVNNLGYSDNLFRALLPALNADAVPYLSSHTIVSPDDPRGYLPDSHFTDEFDDRLAAALVGIVEKGH
jgi:hypothetical protein